MARRGGKTQKQKGTRRERQILALFRKAGLKAERVPLSGSVGGEFAGDLHLQVPQSGTWELEVKARKEAEGWAVLKGWLVDRDAVVMVEDFYTRPGREPIVAMSLMAFLELMRLLKGEAHDDEDAAGGAGEGTGGPVV